jgi:uncharacterized protein (TIGR02145 family)
MKKIIFISTVLAFYISKNQAQTVTDYDGNVYNTVTIGTQVWTKENLNVKHYRNGDEIPEVQDSISWVNQTKGAWCYNENNPANGPDYGRLYNWYAANDSRNIAPVGWHIPTDDEWKTLEIFLGMSPAIADLDQYRGTKEGNALKEPGTNTHWTLDCCPGHSPNAGTNSSGFTALGSGFRWYLNANAPYKSFSPPTGNAQFWTSTAPNDSTAWLRHLCVYHEDIYRDNWKKTNGSSIRLVKDLTTGLNNDLEELQIGLFPNPISNKLTFTHSGNEHITVFLYNFLGQQILQHTFTNTATINTEQLAAGIYFYELRNEKGKLKTGKLIKQ